MAYGFIISELQIERKRGWLERGRVGRTESETGR
jgi:hypothetical protein